MASNDDYTVESEEEEGYDYWTLVTTIEDLSLFIGFIFKFSVLLFLLVKFLQKDKKICNIYFYLVFTGFFWNLTFTFFYNCFNLCWYLHVFEYLVGDSWDNCYHIIMSMNVSEWYHDKFCAIWTLSLTINRLTAIIWWQKYDTLWSRWFKFVLVFILAYPFLINGNTFIVFQCRFQTNTTGCTEVWQLENFIGTISSGIITILSLIVSGITVYFYRKTLKTTKTSAQKKEYKLMYQALLSSFVFIVYYTVSSYDNFLFLDGEQTWQIYGIRAIIKAIYLNTEFVWLLIFSPVVRKMYLKFYFRWLYKLSKTRIQVISIPSSTVSTITSTTNNSTSRSTAHK